MRAVAAFGGEGACGAREAARPAKSAPRRRRSLLRDERGSATTETVIMIPVFIVIFAGLLYFGQGYERAIDTAQLDRQHAWAHAMGGCQGGVPAGTTLSSSSGGGLGGALDSIDSLLSSLTDALPGVSDYWPGLFPKGFSTQRKSRVDKPVLLGSGQAEVSHTISLMCNERKMRDAIDPLTWAAWNVFGL